MPKVIVKSTSTDDELGITWWLVDWEYAGKCGRFKTALDSDVGETLAMDYFSVRAETEARLQCQET